MPWETTNNTQNTEAFEGSSRIFGYLQPGVKIMYVSTKKSQPCRVLPPRNNMLAKNDPAWLGSVLPYRDAKRQFTQWAIRVDVFRSVGNGREDIISQATLNSFGVMHPDYALNPLQMIRLFCFMKGKEIAPRTVTGYSSWADYAKRAEMPKRANDKFPNKIIPNNSTIWMMNVAPVNATSHAIEGNAVAWVTDSAYEKTTARFEAPRPSDQPAVTGDAFSEHYNLGDITSPVHGLLGIPQEFPLDNGKSTTGLVFSSDPYRRVNSLAVPITQQVLEGRYDLMSPKVLKIPTSKQVAEYIAKDGAIPLELLRLAWENTALADLLPSEAAASHHAVANNEWGAAAAAPAAAPAPSVSPAAANLGTKKYHVHNRTTNAQLGEMTDASIRMGIANRQFKASEISLWCAEWPTWKPATEVGFADMPAPVALPPALPPVPPVPPSVPQPPPVAAASAFTVKVTARLDEEVGYASREAILKAVEADQVSAFDQVRTVDGALTTVGALLGIQPKPPVTGVPPVGTATVAYAGTPAPAAGAPAGAQPTPAPAVGDKQALYDEVRATFGTKFDQNNPDHARFAEIYMKSNSGGAVTADENKFMETVVAQLI